MPTLAQSSATRSGASAAATDRTLDPRAARRAAWALYLIVFMSGGILMGVQIAGSRILAPSFGSSIFVWGSLIGLFMGAMALGYFLGGKLADAWPSFGALAIIVSLAGLYTFIMIPYFGLDVCAGIGRTFSDQMVGPLLACTVLFFVPGFLLAMVTPYAIKLNATTLAGLGGVAGSMSALSTSGSIVGTLLTTFLLIPSMKVSNALYLLGVLLIAVAILSLILFKSAVGGLSRADRHKTSVLALIGLACLEVWAIYPARPQIGKDERLVHYEESAYHDIGVTEEVFAEGGRLRAPANISRKLRFNDNTESGIYPYRWEYQNSVLYTDLMHLALVFTPEPKRVLMVGGGGAVAPIQFNQAYGSHVDILEIDPAVRRIAIDYFQAPKGEQAQSGEGQVVFHIGDARMNLKKMEGAYDVIILDAYSSGGQIPFHLLTWQFLRDIKARLTPGGVLVTNIISAVQNLSKSRLRPADLLLAEYKTLTASEAQVLELAQPTAAQAAPLFQESQIYIFPRIYDTESRLQGFEDRHRNVIVIATQEEKRRTLDQILDRVKALLEGKAPRVKVDGKTFLWHAERFHERPYKPEELERIPILQDNYAPVDTMYRPIKREESSRPLF